MTDVIQQFTANQPRYCSNTSRHFDSCDHKMLYKKMTEICIMSLEDYTVYVSLSVIPEFTKFTDKHLDHIHQESSIRAILTHISTAVVQQVNAARDEERAGVMQ